MQVLMDDFNIINLEDLTNATALSGSDLVGVAQGNKSLNKLTIQNLASFIGVNASVVVGDKDTEPSVPSFAFAEQGTYIEWGNQTITSDLGILIYDGTSFSKTEISFIANGIVEQDNTNAVSGGEVFNSVNPIEIKLNELEEGLFTKSKNLFDKSKAVYKRLFANGVHTDNPLYYSILDVEVIPNTVYALSGMRNNSASYVRVVFWDSNHIVINGASLNGNSQTTQIITTPSNAYFMDVMFAQGGNQETVTPFENTFQIEVGDTVTEYEPYSSGGKLRPELLPDIQIIENPNIFYQYDPAGFNGYGKFIVYVKKKGSNDLYIGYNVQREVNTDPLVWVDYYRLFGGTEFKYVGGEMSSQSTTILIPSENEFTFIETGKVDHTGGYHGDEIMTKRAFYADGIKINENASIALTSANDFYYVVESNLTETANASSPTVPIEGHPTVSLHNKKTMFINGGYICRNELIWKKAISVQALYTGLICNARASALSGSNEYLDEGVFNYSTGNNVNKLQSDKAREFYGYNGNRSSFITSKMIARYNDNGEELPNYDGKVEYYIQDRANDAKYYRIIKNKNVTINERWIVESKIEFI